MLEYLDYLREFNFISIVFRVFLALFVSGLLGIERGIKNRPAGLRTYMLVSVGSCLVMLTGEYVFSRYGEAGDPTRLAAQVVSGIGFLGAGTIITTGDQKVKGITTAASIWTSACLGIACGVGFYEGILIGAITMFIIMVAFRRLDRYIKETAKHIRICVEYDHYSDRKQLYEFLADRIINIEHINVISKGKKPGEIPEVEYMLDLNGNFEEDIIHRLEIIDGIKTVHRI